ncbi:hypothetical protein [Ferirhizobium litorale]|uniref:Uncharacterized protein n=1 Tax=Ferirhizobium litorale TaxID=2927786 RepID=A0AAE3QCW2_9HYPH|nr:hypothetical protein [Fererhizobium litorale]MDI7923387.1 hypothetical protein [Fererhizobium litorale]
MSRRLRSAEESARREIAAARSAAYTLAADSTAPRDHHRRVEHYRRHLVDAHIVIDSLRQRITELEAEVEKVKRDCAYSLSLCVTRTAAEEAYLGAFRLARGKAAILAEGSDGIPNPLSDAIDNLPDPKPRFTK